MIPDDVIEQVRDAADLVGIIGEQVELKRTGSDYRGPCPFHGGTHRNFAVIPKKGMFYCYVCHEAGDVFTFFMKKLGMDYPTAVREVARRVGVTIPERGSTGPDPREPLFSAVAAAADWFARQLREGAEGETARGYLAGRGLDLETAGLLGLGYAPRGTAFLDAMKGLGVREEVLLEAGLLFRREDGTLGSRFRGRLLFPIQDLRARVVGFGGRILGEGEPKYLNSPDTPVFHKGQILYHLHAARHAMRKAERAILVEGYFDVLRLALAGIEEVVAPLGTGLTADQAVLLKRHSSQVILLYDSDEAGLRATFRAGDELLRRGLRVSVATLPEGEDPDTIVQHRGAAALEPVLKDAVDVLERKIQILERRGLFGDIQGRRRALDRLLPTIRAARGTSTYDLYVRRTADRVGIKVEAVEKEAGSATGAVSDQVTEDVRPHIPANSEKWLLLLVLVGEPWKSRVREIVAPDQFTYPLYRTVYKAVLDETLEDLDETAARVYEELKAEGIGDRSPDALFEGAVNRMQVQRYDRKIEEIDRRLPLETGEAQDKLVREKEKLTKERNALMPKWKIATRRSGAPGS